MYIVCIYHWRKKKKNVREYPNKSLDWINKDLIYFYSLFLPDRNPMWISIDIKLAKHISSSLSIYQLPPCEYKQIFILAPYHSQIFVFRNSIIYFHHLDNLRFQVWNHHNRITISRKNMIRLNLSLILFSTEKENLKRKSIWGVWKFMLFSEVAIKVYEW